MESESGVFRLVSRRALAVLGIEIFLGGEGATRLPVDERVIYMIVLSSTLHGDPISASRVSLISGMPRTNVTRRLNKLRNMGIVSNGPDGWRVTPEHAHRSASREWIVRMEAIVKRTYEAILSDPDR